MLIKGQKNGQKWGQNGPFWVKIIGGLFARNWKNYVKYSYLRKKLLLAQIAQKNPLRKANLLQFYRHTIHHHHKILT